MQTNPELRGNLPEPDAESAAHSKRVAAYINDVIEQAGGSISFAEYMQQALYAPGLGYYSAGATKLGSDGMTPRRNKQPFVNSRFYTRRGRMG